MRFQRTAALLGLVVLWLALGPWVFLAALGLLFVARVRDWLRPTRRVGGILVAVAAAVTGLVLRDPRRLAAGAARARARSSRPGTSVARRCARPVAAAARPGRRPTGPAPRGPGRSGSRPGSTPRGTASGSARAWPFDGHGRLVGLCGDRHGPMLRVIDPDSMRPLVGPRTCPTGPRATARRRGRSCAAGRRTSTRRTAPSSRPPTGACWSSPPTTPRATRTSPRRRATTCPGRCPADDCLVALRPDGRGGHLVRHAGTGGSARSTPGPAGPRCWTSARTSPTRSPSTATACTS